MLDFSKRIRTIASIKDLHPNLDPYWVNYWTAPEEDKPQVKTIRAMPGLVYKNSIGYLAKTPCLVSYNPSEMDKDCEISVKMSFDILEKQDNGYPYFDERTRPEYIATRERMLADPERHSIDASQPIQLVHVSFVDIMRLETYKTKWMPAKFTEEVGEPSNGGSFFLHLQKLTFCKYKNIGSKDFRCYIIYRNAQGDYSPFLFNISFLMTFNNCNSLQEACDLLDSFEESMNKYETIELLAKLEKETVPF
jgi:hypothetical protein